MKILSARHYLLSVSLPRAQVDNPDRYPFSLPAVAHLDHLRFHPAVTFFVGENGTGKSTLLEALAVASGFNPEGGSRNFNFSTRPSHSELHRFLRIERGLRRPRDGYFLRAESYFNVATTIEAMDSIPAPAPPVIDSYGGRSLHEQSHGESFWALVMNRFGGQGLYILDEPEAALSPSRQLALLARMHQLVRQDSQFIIATHSPLIMAYPNATLYQLSSDGIHAVSYTETEHYMVTKDFLTHRERMLKDLLDEEPGEMV